MSHQLVVQVTQKDDRLNEHIEFIATAAARFAWKKLWDGPDLSAYAGGADSPLVLFGHANVSNFVDEYGGGVRFSTYLAGDKVVARLKELMTGPLGPARLHPGRRHGTRGS